MELQFEMSPISSLNVLLNNIAFIKIVSVTVLLTEWLSFIDPASLTVFEEWPQESSKETCYSRSEITCQ